jgi:hypothetical protein
LSTHNNAPAFFEISAIAAISVMFISGLVGVSIQISFVSEVTADSTSARLAVSR